MSCAATVEASVVDASPPAATTTATGKKGKKRGRKKGWSHDGPLSVIELELDLSGDPETRRRVEKQFAAAFELQQALRRDARSRCKAYGAARKERARTSPKEVRERLGLTKSGLQNAAYRHIDNSRWMRDHLTKALACHMGSNMWETASRHLFPDESGKYLGMPKVGKWWDFTRIAGRARSHTKTQKVWETWRLVGSLEDHLATYGTAATVEDALNVPVGTTLFNQPGVLPRPVATPRGLHGGGWWSYRGPLAVVFTGLPAGDLAMPVRLPAGRGNLERLIHFLDDPASWHKIDLIRIRDHHAPGGWRYQAHLTVLKAGYQAPSTVARRAVTPTDRLAGLDANVSNVAAFSTFASIRTDLDSHPEAALAELVTPTDEQERVAVAAKLADRKRQRALDRSRRSTNRDQYHLSKRQAKRAARREAAGLPAKTVDMPRGARKANAKKVPERAYRHDTLSKTYRTLRSVHAQKACSTAERKKANAKAIAARLVSTHGNRWVTEKVNIGNWTRLWGARIAVTTPGRMVAAIKAETLATGGRWRLASTRMTAMSQHCLCRRKEAKPLDQRWHSCPECCLEADRDILSAALAAAVSFTDPEDPSTARVDPVLSTVIARRIGAQKEGHLRSTIAYRATDNAVGRPTRKGRPSAGVNDSAGTPRNRKPKPTRWAKEVRRRNSQTTSGAPPGASF